MAVDASSVKLKAGDIMIQRGTNHAWGRTAAANTPALRSCWSMRSR
jgi:hypothetical protein